MKSWPRWPFCFLSHTAHNLPGLTVNPEDSWDDMSLCTFSPFIAPIDFHSMFPLLWKSRPTTVWLQAFFKISSFVFKHGRFRTYRFGMTRGWVNDIIFNHSFNTPKIVLILLCILGKGTFHTSKLDVGLTSLFTQGYETLLRSRFSSVFLQS